MRKIVGIFFFVLAVVAGPSLFAQATRTWVSGVGDDANPCSRTAPCKTFAGAISKTAAGGEISVLDPGGFGAVTITKSITINGAGTLASILFSQTNGVVINGADIVVNIVDISLNGGTPAAPGVNGIRIIQAAAVNVVNCDIFNFSAHGITDERTTGGALAVRNTRIHDSIGTGTRLGIRVTPAGGVVAANHLLVDNCQIYNHRGNFSAGIGLSEGGRATITRSTIHSTERGVSVANAFVSVTDSTIFRNATGVRSSQSAVVMLAGCMITENTVNGLDFGGGNGTINSFGNNYIARNTGNNGAGMVAIPLQ